MNECMNNGPDLTGCAGCRTGGTPGQEERARSHLTREEVEKLQASPYKALGGAGRGRAGREHLLRRTKGPAGG